MTEPHDLLTSLGETFQKKESDYGHTWIVSGIALSALHEGPITLKTDTDHIINGNTHRLLDKVLRGYNASVVKGNTDEEINFEAAQDSFEDASVYAAMLASVLADNPTERITECYEKAINEAGDGSAAADGISGEGEGNTDSRRCGYTGNPLPDTGWVEYMTDSGDSLYFESPTALVKALSPSINDEAEVDNVAHLVIDAGEKEIERRAEELERVDTSDGESSSQADDKEIKYVPAGSPDDVQE